MTSCIKPKYNSVISGRELGLITGYEFDIQGGGIINKEASGLGGGDDGSLLGCVQSYDPVFGRGLRFPTNYGLVNTSQTGDNSSGTISVTLRFWETLLVDRYVMVDASIFPPPASYFRIFFNNRRLWTRFGTEVNQDSGWDYTVGKAFRLTVRWTSTHVYVYVDDVLIDDYDTTFTNSLEHFRIGGTGLWLPTTTIDHEEWDFLLYRRTLSEEEVWADFFRIAQRLNFFDKLQGVSVDPVGQSSGFIKGGYWEASGGPITITDAELPHNAHAKAYAAPASGVMTLRRQYVNIIDAEMLWGRHEFWLKYSGTAFMAFIADGSNIFADSGYLIEASAGGTGRLTVYEVTAGAFNTLFGSVADILTVDAWNKISVDRRHDGRFHVYVDDILAEPSGVYTNPFTDATHSVAHMITATMGAGNEFTEYRKTYGNLTP